MGAENSAAGALADAEMDPSDTVADDADGLARSTRIRWRMRDPTSTSFVHSLFCVVALFLFPLFIVSSHRHMHMRADDASKGRLTTVFMCAPHCTPQLQHL